MRVPKRSLKLRKAQAAIRQIEGAISALENGDFDIAVTLAGAAEGMLKVDHPHMWSIMLQAATDLGYQRKALTSRANKIRDWLKHGDALSSKAVTVISQFEAASMIVRAITKLKHSSPRMEEFIAWFLSAYPEVLNSE